MPSPFWWGYFLCCGVNAIERWSMRQNGRDVLNLGMGKRGLRRLCTLLLLIGMALPGFAQRDWREFLSPRGRILDLSGRGLFELPWQELQPDIEVLILDDNDLYEISPALSQACPNLRALSVNDNHLREIGPFITNLPRLEELYLNGNEIRGLPPQLGRLRFLRVLSLQSNDLTQNGLDWNAIRGVEVLLLDDNDLFAVPAEVEALPFLRELSLRQNRVDFVDAALARCRQLEVLDLSENARLERLPPELRFLEQLYYIDVAETKINAIPDWTNEMPALEYFVLEKRE